MKDGSEELSDWVSTTRHVYHKRKLVVTGMGMVIEP